MQSLRNDLYEEAFRLWNMVPADTSGDFGPAGCLHTFDSPAGSGRYWAYFRDNMFAVNAFEMRFFEPGEMRYQHTEHLSIAYYDAVEGVVQNEGVALRVGCACSYIGDEGGVYHARYQAGASARASSITISPDYYRDYLQARFGTPEDIRADFRLVDGRGDLPELAALFRRLRDYRGRGVTADLFYEGAVAEALSIVIDKAHDIASRAEDAPEPSLTREDAQAVDELCAFIAGNLSGDLSCETLAARAFVGQTKLKRIFKAATGTTPVAYVSARRMERARELIAKTDLPIAQVASQVGYRNAGAFSAAFRRHFGCTPTSTAPVRR